MKIKNISQKRNLSSKHMYETKMAK